MKYINLFLILVSLLACSITKKKDSTDLVKVFTLGKKKFNKFETTSEGDVEFVLRKKKRFTKAVKSKKKTSRINKKIHKKTLTKTGEARFAEKKSYLEKIKNLIKRSNEKEQFEEIVEETFVYPENFPEKFIEYDRESQRVWNKFTPFFFPGEEFKFEISLLGVTAGYVSLKTFPIVKLGNTPVFKFQANMVSAKFYEYIYKIDDYIESYVDTDDFLPMKYTLTQDETNQKVDDLQLFDKETLKTHFWYKRLKKGKKKNVKKTTHTPRYFQDSFSVLYFVRGLPMTIGEVYKFPIMTRAKMWMLRMEIEKIEEIKVMGKWVKAIKIKAETRFPGVLKKKGDISFWYSNDKSRKLLKFEAKVKLGSIKGTLRDYKPGKKLNYK